MTSLRVSKPQSANRLRHEDVPALDDLQAGHIRHIDNLSRQAVNDWRHMMGRRAMQEDYGAYRYQLAYMAYALALTHYHRLPAAPALFKGALDRLIEKMIHPEVWLYWRDSSTGRGFFTMDVPELESRIDPVADDNIMYSAYLQTMTLLYTMLFGDKKYEKPGSLTFEFKPLLWGRDRHQSLAYDQRSLNDKIYWNMVAGGYLGVACEPYCVFQICNQVPILGFRLHDHLYGGDLAGEVTEGYSKAWQEFGGILDADQRFSTLVVTSSKQLIPAMHAWSDGWCGMLMNTWQPDLVRDVYERVSDRWLVRSPTGTVSVPDEEFPGMENPPVGADSGGFGWMAAWASEMGDEAAVKGMMAHADAFMNPSWENEGYFYPRQDELRDAKGNQIAVNPTVGNALLPYARLNVKDGLRAIYQKPWAEEERQRPSVSDLADKFDLRRAWFDEDGDRLLLTLKGRRGARGRGELVIDNVWSRGDWTLEADGEAVLAGVGGEITLSSSVAGKREGNALRVSLPLKKTSDVSIAWT
jgi:hypothetical protein